MHYLLRRVCPPARYAAYILSLAGLAVSLPAWLLGVWWLWPAALVFAALSALGTRDILQRRHTVSRNYPILAHLRYGLESIGPEIRQYFIESDTEERPFSRQQRAVVYQRAKQVHDKKPFGTLLDVYAEGYEWLSPSLRPAPVSDPDFRVTVGADPARPYSTSLLNVSAMSFGALSANAITALNAGAARGGFYHDTGEGAISRYHLSHGADLVWEIGSGYFGCRDADGRFNAERFREHARRDSVRMIEIKLSQGAKPGHGGILPAAKVTAEIAETREVPVGQDVISPASHSAFRTPRELMDFICELRELADGKPVGIKLAIGQPWEWFGIVKAMLASGEHPDFVVVDGGEGGTGAAPLEFINRLGMPLNDGLLLVHNTLVGAGLRERVRVAAAGKITTAFHIARTLALGADWCNSARGFMFSLGCIQSLSCHTDRCPTGVATQDPRRGANLDVTDKGDRVYHFHRSTLTSLAEMLAATGLSHPSEIGPEHVLRRISRTEALSYRDLHQFLMPGELLEGDTDAPMFRDYWASARPDSFAPPAEIAGLRTTKLR
ncbi:FMN-binding glutamate synthase family protein [Arhodomonas sp. SL1]|uniref:FMN-binding glutamate synthase family protein n=1 Tax=Arhodomonas sp. SL1 TaxID=3425691 RepID=UPI003F8824F4